MIQSPVHTVPLSNWGRVLMIRLLVLATIMALAACTRPDDVRDPVAPGLDLPDASPIRSGIPLRLTGVSRWTFDNAAFVTIRRPDGTTSTSVGMAGELTVSSLVGPQSFKIRVTDMEGTVTVPRKAPDFFSLRKAAPGAVMHVEFDTSGQHASVRMEPPNAVPALDTGEVAKKLKANWVQLAERRPLVTSARQGDIVFRLPAEKAIASQGVQLLDKDAEIEYIAAGEVQQDGKRLVLLRYQLRPRSVWTGRVGFGIVKAACSGYELLDPDSGWSPQYVLQCNLVGQSGSQEATGTLSNRSRSKPFGDIATSQQAVSTARDTSRTETNGPSAREDNDTMSIPFAASWEGVDDILLGTLTVAGTKNSGRLEVSAGQLDCTGQWQWVGGKYGTGDLPHGTWTLACNNGKAAAGTYRSRERGKGIGTGIDNDQGTVKVTFGRS